MKKRDLLKIRNFYLSGDNMPTLTLTITCVQNISKLPADLKDHHNITEVILTNPPFDENHPEYKKDRFYFDDSNYHLTENDMTLTLNALNALNAHKQITSLTITECLLAPKESAVQARKALKVLASALKVDKKITSLNLQTNEINAKGGEILGDALQENTILREVNLANNPECTEGIAKGMAKNSSVQRLDLSIDKRSMENNCCRNEGPIFAEMLRQNTSLQHLNISGRTGMDEPTAQAWESVLEQNKTLINLNMRDTFKSASMEALELFLKGLSKNNGLQFIDFGGLHDSEQLSLTTYIPDEEFGEEDLPKIREILTRNRDTVPVKEPLGAIDLIANFIQTRKRAPFLHMIFKNSTCKVKNAEKLFQAVFHNPYITVEFDFGNNEDLEADDPEVYTTISSRKEFVKKIQSLMQERLKSKDAVAKTATTSQPSLLPGFAVFTRPVSSTQTSNTKPTAASRAKSHIGSKPTTWDATESSAPKMFEEALPSLSFPSLSFPSLPQDLLNRTTSQEKKKRQEKSKTSEKRKSEIPKTEEFSLSLSLGFDSWSPVSYSLGNHFKEPVHTGKQIKPKSKKTKKSYELSTELPNQDDFTLHLSPSQSDHSPSPAPEDKINRVNKKQKKYR